MLYPATEDVLAVHSSVNAWGRSWTALPESEITIGELLAVLETVTLPVAGPATVGEKVTLSVAVWPGARISPPGTPETLNSAPDGVALRIVTGEVPELVSVMLRALLAPTIPFGNDRLKEFAVNCPGPVVTVRIAGLLVATPEEFATTTLNSDPLSVVVSEPVV